SAKEMVFYCGCCKKENLCCFVDIASGWCAGCIAVHAECELFIPKEEWEKVKQEKRGKELEVARLEALLAQSKLELLEMKSREQEFARCNLSLLRVQEKGK
ncbi:hypothetical protein K491DRAFT_573795, partial [Lophiostoma macrostomum CBS 122681]